MSNLNHEKRNRAESTRRSLLLPSNFPKDRKWLTLPFGKHSGLTLPTIFFADPEYIDWLNTDGVINGSTSYGRELQHQLSTIIRRSQRIAVPALYGAGAKFVTIVDRDNVFERFVIVSKGSLQPKLPKGSKAVKRSKYLAVNIVYDFDDHKLGFERMAQSLRKAFISKTSPKSAKEQYQAFFDND